MLVNGKFGAKLAIFKSGTKIFISTIENLRRDSSIVTSTVTSTQQNQLLQLSRRNNQSLIEYG